MTALRSHVSDTQILFGSDFPFFPLTYCADMFARLKLPRAARRAIGRENAQTLLPRWT